MVMIYSLLTTAPSALTVSPSWCMSTLASLQTSALSATIEVCYFFFFTPTCHKKKSFYIHVGDFGTCCQSGAIQLLVTRWQESTVKDRPVHRNNDRRISQCLNKKKKDDRKNRTVSSILTWRRSCLLLSQGVLSDELEFIKMCWPLIFDAGCEKVFMVHKGHKVWHNCVKVNGGWKPGKRCFWRVAGKWRRWGSKLKSHDSESEVLTGHLLTKLKRLDFILRSFFFFFEVIKFHFYVAFFFLHKVLSLLCQNSPPIMEVSASIAWRKAERIKQFIPLVQTWHHT